MPSVTLPKIAGQRDQTLHPLSEITSSVNIVNPTQAQVNGAPIEVRAGEGTPTLRTPLRQSPTDIHRFLKYILADGHCLEIRILGCDFNQQGLIVPPSERWPDGSIVYGYFDSADEAVAALSKIRGVSAYATLNPVNRDLLSRRANRLAKAGKKDALTSDPDIAFVRYLFLDIDPKRPKGISSTDDERKRCYERLDEIHDAYPGMREASIWGSSGNGVWCLVRLDDLPNDESTKRLIADAVDAISECHTRDGIEVDLAPKNAARIMCIPGTIKCKGDSTSERPHRLATIDSDDGERRAFDLAAFVAANPPKSATAAAEAKAKASTLATTRTGGKIAFGNGGADPAKRAEAYIATMDPAIQGNHGSDALYAVACVANRFALSEGSAFQVIKSTYNPRCDPEWSDKEIHHKIADAYKDFPHERGVMLDKDREGHRPIQPPTVGTIERHQGDEQQQGEPPARQTIIEAVKATVETGGIESIYRDATLSRAIGTLSGSKLAELKTYLSEVPGFKATIFNAMVKEEKQKARRKAGPSIDEAEGFTAWAGESLYIRSLTGYMVMTNMEPDSKPPRPTDDTKMIRLTNFTASIATEVTRDSGVDQARRYAIEGVMDGGEIVTADVAAEHFEEMKWVQPNFGCGAIIYAERGTREHTRVAIQSFSNPIHQTVYTHTGWRKIGDRWVYLHVGGAIGEDGQDDGITVDIGDSLAGFRLPPPPTGDRRRDAVRASLRQADLASDDNPKSKGLAAIVMSYAYRAAMGQARYSIQFTGPTGTHKSCLAALMQQHFAASMGFANLPAGWNSTSNALGSLLHTLADSILVIDDFVPGSSPRERERLEKQADEILRAQGNGQGRQRMRSDGKLMPAMNPRGSMVMTGEDRPGKTSALARTLSVFFDRAKPDGTGGTVDKARLSACQRDADAGLYAESMSAFLQWMAPRHDEILEHLAARAAKRKAIATRPGTHPRTADDIADLASAFSIFLDFAVDCGAVGLDEAERIEDNHWLWLAEVADAMSDELTAEQNDPQEIFLDSIRSALHSGQAYIVDIKTEDVPDGQETRCGWRQELKWHGGDVGQLPIWVVGPNSKRIGWVDDTTVYLDPTISYSVAQAMRKDHAEGIPSSRMVHKLLHSTGKLSRVDNRKTSSGTPRSIARITVGKNRVNALCVKADAVWGKAEADEAKAVDEEGSCEI